MNKLPKQTYTLPSCLVEQYIRALVDRSSIEEAVDCNCQFGLLKSRLLRASRPVRSRVDIRFQVESIMKDFDKRKLEMVGLIAALLLWINVCCFSPAALAETGAQVALKATDQTIEQLTKKINPKIVEIEARSWTVDHSTGGSEQAGYLVRDNSIGAGVLLTSTGEILTNHHVIRGAQQITIHLYGSTTDYNARKIGDDPEADLALLKIEASELPHLELGKGSVVKQGQIVLAVG
ncbi:MAG TPA: trypsin-like peptidase domain-containing protein, partial [Acidobacteriaceae bacterium]